MSRAPVRMALEGVKVHRAHVRDVEIVHTIRHAHVRGLFFDGKCSPHVSEVFSMKKRCPLMSAVILHKNDESAPLCGARFLR